MRTLLATSVLLASAAASAAPAPLMVTTDAVGPGATLSTEYTCDGAAKAPTIQWSAVPSGTKTIAILVDDPDAERGPFTHLLVTNVPASATSLDLGSALPSQASLLRNDTGADGYIAPCPKDGNHTYHFRVFALSGTIKAAPITRAVTRASFLRGIKGHILAEGEAVGTYKST